MIMIADEPDAIVIPSPHFFLNRYGQTAKWIICHGTAGGSSATAIGDMFAGSDQVASHYIVGRDGAVVQCVLEKDGAWANGGISGWPGTSGDGVHHDTWWTAAVNPNLETITIEFVKPSTDNSDALTSQQEIAGFKLIQHICDRNNIPKRAADAQGGITGHYSMDPVNRSHCPGLFPFDRLFTFLDQGGVMLDLSLPFVASFFEDVGNDIWRCKSNGKVIGHDILMFYRVFLGILVYRLPISDEWSPKPGVTLQRFEGGVLCYDPQRVYDNPFGSQDLYRIQGYQGSVYPAKIYESFAVDPRLDALNTQNQTLQSQLANALAQNTTMKTQLAQRDATALSTAEKTALAGIATLAQQCAIELKTTMTAPIPPSTLKGLGVA